MFNRYKFKRHIKIGRALLVCVSLFIVSACGIPTSIYLNNGITDEDDVSYYSFDSVKYSSTDSYITTLTFNIDDEYVVEDSPSIVYFYSIYTSDIFGLNETTFSTKITDAFESTYTDLPGRRLNTNSDSDPYVLSVSYGSGDIKLYKFSYSEDLTDTYYDQDAMSYLTTVDDSESDDTVFSSTGIEYTVNFNIQKIVDSSDSSNFYIDFNQVEEDSSDSENYFSFNTLVSSGFKSSTNTFNLKRFNNDNFIVSDNMSNITETDYDYLFTDIDDFDTSETYSVLIYAALTVEGDFTNIFWSDLHEVGSFDL